MVRMASLISFAFIILTTSTAYPLQSTVDSPKPTFQKLDTAKILRLVDLAKTNFRNNPIQTIEYANEIISLSETLNFTKGIIEGKYYLSRAQWYKGDYQDALTTAFDGLWLCQELEDLGSIAKYKGLVGSILGTMGNYPMSLSYFFESLSILEEIDDQEEEARCLNNIGFVIMKLGEYQRAATFFERSAAINREMKRYDGLAINYNNAGVCYKELQNFPKALDYLQKALNLSKEIDFLPEIAVVQRSFSETYYELKDYKNALKFVLEAIELQRKLASKIELARSLNMGAKVYLKINQPNEAIKLASEANQLSTEIGSALEKMHSLEMLSRAYIQNKEFEKATELQSQYLIAKDSLFNTEKAKEIAKIEFQKAIEQKEKENQLLLKEQELTEAMLHQKENQRIAFLVISGLMGLVLVTIFVALRNQLKANRKINRQRNELAKVAKELKKSNKKLSKLSQFKEGLTHMIAHDMKNSLNTILGFSSIDSKDKKMHNISKAGNLMLNMVSNMLDVQRFEEAKVPLDIRSHDVEEIIEEARSQVALLLQMKSLQLRSEIDQSTPLLHVDREIIIRVLVNLLSNAIKYSSPGKNIWLTTKSVDNTMKICVADEGKGMSSEKIPLIFKKYWQDNAQKSGSTASTGLGLTFCKLAVEAHNGKIEVDSEVNKGTTFCIKLPLSPKVVIAKKSSKPSINGEREYISKEEKVTLIELAKALEGLEVYQVGELNTLFKQFDIDKLKSRWALDLQAAIYHGNEEKYKELIHQIK